MGKSIHPRRYEWLIKKLPENSIIVRGICACRVARKPCQKFYDGKCDHPVDTCIFIKYGAEKFLKARKETKKISKNEVKRIFQTMFQRGFFLSLYFCVDKQEYAICICCRDGCIPTVSTLDYNLNGLVKGDKYATLITENCIGCGLCQEVCSFDAIVLESVAKINQHKCFGCGQCLTCPNGAIQLVERTDSHLKIF